MAEPSTAPGDRGVVVGRDVIKSIIIPGDLNRVFVGDYEPLGDAYIEPWSVFERVDLNHFAGREWLLKEIDTFLDGNDRGYFVLEAKAGLGKTAFLAWLVRERGYIHHFAELAPGLAGVETGLRNLAAQLVLAYFSADEVVGVLPGAASRPDYLLKLLRQAAEKRRDGEKIVLVVDALDEAGVPSNQNVLGLPRVLPEGVFLIVSKRPVPVNLYVEASRTPRRVFQLTAGSDENQADMRSFLERAAIWPGIDQALQDSGYTAEQFTRILMEKCQGVWVYLHYVVHEIDQGERKSLNLNLLPDGMTQYYARFWKRWRDENDDQWYEIYLPLMATLAAVREAIPINRLAGWAGVKEQIAIARLRRLLCERWRHFIAIVSRDRQDRYQFYHATLRDFCEGQVEREKLTEDEQTFVSELKQATINACRRIMRNAQEPEVRRDAAFRLTRLDWFASPQDVSPDEMLTHLELIGRYVYSPADREYLVENITSMLDSDLPDDRQRAQLLIYRAGMWAELSEFLDKASLLDAAAEDYETAGQIVNRFTEEDHRLSIRVNLGVGNIASIRAEMLTEPEGQTRRRELLKKAAKLYLTAAESTRAYGQDVFLEVGIYYELSYTYALLQNWAEAEGAYRNALEILETAKERLEDPTAYVRYYGRVLETAGDVHCAKGQHLASQGDSSQALCEYEAAYELAQKAIAALEKSLGESRGLVIAYVNSGDYLLAMSECSGCLISQPLAEVCKNWRTALDMARRLGLLDLEQEAHKRLEGQA